jgi:hypothetical protein
VACGSNPNEVTGQAPEVRAVLLELDSGQLPPAAEMTIGVGASPRFRARVSGGLGVSQAVRWTSSAPTIADVSNDGVVTTCYPGGSATITAQSVADPSKTAAVRLLVNPLGIGWISINAPRRSGTDVIVPFDSLSGTVDVPVGLSPEGVLPCRAVERVELRIRGAALDSVVARIPLNPPATRVTFVRATIETASTFAGRRLLPNGSYVLSAAVFVTGLAQPVLAPEIPIMIRN